MDAAINPEGFGSSAAEGSNAPLEVAAGATVGTALRQHARKPVQQRRRKCTEAPHPAATEPAPTDEAEPAPSCVVELRQPLRLNLAARAYRSCSCCGTRCDQRPTALCTASAKPLG